MRSSSTSARDGAGGWFVYLLECADGSLYCGATNDPWRRFLVHESGKGARYTRARLPVRLVFVEETASRSEALSLEHRIKRLSASTKRQLVEGARARSR